MAGVREELARQNAGVRRPREKILLVLQPLVHGHDAFVLHLYEDENDTHGASGRPKNPGSLTRMIVAMVCLVGSGQLSCGFRVCRDRVSHRNWQAHW